MIIRNEDGLILDANPACLAALDWARDEFVGRTIGDVGFWPGLDLAEGRSRASTDRAEVVHTRSGERRKVLVSTQHIDVNDEACSVALFHDVTERWQLRKQLVASEKTLQAFLDFAPAVISARDTQGRVLLHNQGHGSKFGRPTDSASGDAASSIITPGLAEWSSALETKVIETGTEVRGETQLVDHDGRTLVYEITKFPLRSADGEIYAVGTIGTDVTEDREATEALRLSEQRFQQLATSIDELFLLWEQGTLEMLYVSPAVERITGLDEGRFRDPAARLAIVHPDDRDLLSSPPSPLKEMRIVKPDGETRWIRARTTLVATDDGLPGHGATTMTDITDQKVAEMATQSAMAQAEQANRAKSEFLSRMSHELRTPLNAVLGFGQLLEADARLDDEHRGRAHQITKAGRHLLALINEVLDISRIESGQMSMSLEPVRLGDVIEDALELVRPMATAAGVRLLSDPRGWGQHVQADRQRLEQVVLNLLTNAVKYNRESGQVRLRCDTTPADIVRLVVADTGIGIASESRKDLFKPFARLGAERSDVEGTGLGLAHSKHLVEAMHGAIGVDSELGVGSEFWIELPAARAPSVADAMVPFEQAALKPNGSTTRTVLFIEDNPANVRLMQDIIEQRPRVSLAVATHGAEGLELARDHQPCLILLDVHLPDMHGQEVLRRLRADPATATIPVVVVSADATRGQVDDLLALGADDHITKPFTINEMLAVIDQDRP